MGILCLGRAGAAGPGPGPSAPDPRGPLGTLGTLRGTFRDLWAPFRDSPEQPLEESRVCSQVGMTELPEGDGDELPS